jgi:hypothetical protein
MNKLTIFVSSLLLIFSSCQKSDKAEYTLNGTTLTDNRDNQQYNVVTIGNKIWMADNYNYNVTGSKYYNDNSSKTFGRLYSWNQINTPGFTPKGWRVPTLQDYNDLITNLGGDATIVGGKLKTTGTSVWVTPNTSASNSSGFNGLPGGCYVNNSNGVTGYNYQTYVGFWWIMQERTSDFSYSFRLNYNNSTAEINPNGWKPDFYSVRLIKE